MTIQYAKFFAPTVLTTSAATLYTMNTTPASGLLRGGRVRFHNTTANSASVTAYAVPSGGAAAAGNAFLTLKSIPPRDYMDIDLPILSAGDTLQALSDTATAITAHSIAGGLFSS